MIYSNKKLHIRYRFIGLKFIAATINGDIYQLPHFSNNRTKSFRRINQILIGGSLGYRINRKFYTSNKIKELAYLVDEYYTYDKVIICPF